MASPQLNQRNSINILPSPRDGAIVTCTCHPRLVLTSTSDLRVQSLRSTASKNGSSWLGRICRPIESRFCRYLLLSKLQGGRLHRTWRSCSPFLMSHPRFFACCCFFSVCMFRDNSNWSTIHPQTKHPCSEPEASQSIPICLHVIDFGAFECYISISERFSHEHRVE